MKKNILILLFVLLFLSGCSNEEVISFPEQIHVAGTTDIIANDWENKQTYRLNEAEKTALFALLKGDYQPVKERTYQKILQDEKNESPYSFQLKGNLFYVDVFHTSDTYFIGIESIDASYMLEISKETYAELKQFVMKLERVCSQEDPCT